MPPSVGSSTSLTSTVADDFNPWYSTSSVVWPSAEGKSVLFSRRHNFESARLTFAWAVTSRVMPSAPVNPALVWNV